MSINVLPDETLLAIFDFYTSGLQVLKEDIEAWQILVHVCRRWRSIVFESPRRLNLRLVGTPKTPVRDMLDVWPALPLIVSDYGFLSKGLDNIIAMLEHSDRVCQIELEFTSTLRVETVLATMQVPFPELTRLSLHSQFETVSDLLDSLLAGSAPRLRFLSLENFVFPALPKLLLSTTYLVDLRLCKIPSSAYISPETMVTLISTLTSLGSLSLEFKSRRSRPDQASRRPPPLIRSVLPVFTFFSFKGVSEYIDDLVARIDAPRLNSLYINFIDQSEFSTPQLIEFICRTPKLKALKEAQVAFSNFAAWIYLSSGCIELCVEILCRKLSGQLSSLGKVCTSCLPPLSTLENLYILMVTNWLSSRWAKDMQYGLLWLELLRPFTGVKNLYVSEEMAQRVVPELQVLVGVLPTLENLFLEELPPSGPVQEDIEEFINTQQVSSHPIAVSLWDRQPSSPEHLHWLIKTLRH